MRTPLPIAALALVLSASGTPAPGAQDPVRLFMPDGQLQSHPVRVFVTEDLSLGDDPLLILRGSHALTDVREGEEVARKPQFVARHHDWVQTVAGEQVAFRGTLLVFDLSGYPIPFYKAAMRVTPALGWTRGGMGGKERAVALGDREVYLGNIVAAVGWTLALVVAVLAGIALACRRVGGRTLCAVHGPDGKLSLSRVQVAAWTVATGSMVAVFGWIRLEPPHIPASLVALMGMSLATGGINYVQVRRRHRAAPAVPLAPVPGARGFGDALAELVQNGEGEVAITKAQMVFWTVLTLTLFVAKSLLEGTLWEVPWPMVALMGMGQAGYLAPKLPLDGTGPPGAPAPQPAPPAPRSSAS